MKRFVKEKVKDKNPELEAKHISIQENESGHSYQRLHGPYLKGAKQVELQDPYVRMNHQVRNLLEFTHDRHITIDTGWNIIPGRGLNIYQRWDRGYFAIESFSPEARLTRSFEIGDMRTE